MKKQGDPIEREGLVRQDELWSAVGGSGKQTAQGADEQKPTSGEKENGFIVLRHRF